MHAPTNVNFIREINFNERISRHCRMFILVHFIDYFHSMQMLLGADNKIKWIFKINILDVILKIVFLSLLVFVFIPLSPARALTDFKHLNIFFFFLFLVNFPRNFHFPFPNRRKTNKIQIDNWRNWNEILLIEMLLS